MNYTLIAVSVLCPTTFGAPGSGDSRTTVPSTCQHSQVCGAMCHNTHGACGLLLTQRHQRHTWYWSNPLKILLPEKFERVLVTSDSVGSYSLQPPRGSVLQPVLAFGNSLWHPSGWDATPRTECAASRRDAQLPAKGGRIWAAAAQ